MLETVSCPNCGKEVGEGDTFCATCGTNVTPVPPAMDGIVAGLQPVEGDDLLLGKLREATVGEYEVRALLGRGGMASVFIAYDLALNRRVALKAMHPGLLGDAGMRERFRLEARLSARLDHPNIVTVHAVKERGGIVFFDLKLIEGTSLDRVMRYRSAPLPGKLARWVTGRIADALHYAHGEGVIHRDVKPANVMLDRRGDPTMTDFGIAKASESPQLTMTGAIVGTPAYMSPEQCLATEITAASDQYSLGVMAYELLTGHVPFSGSLLAIQLGHVEKTPPAPIAIVADIPQAVSDAVMRMMAKKPEDRWPTLGAAGEALIEGLGATDTQMRRELGALIASMPGDVVRSFPPTPRTSTPLTFGSPVTGSPVTGSPVTGSPVTGSPVTGSRVAGASSAGASAVSTHAHERATEAVETGAALEPTPVGALAAVQQERARRRLFQLGGVAAAGIGIVALIAVLGGDNETAAPESEGPRAVNGATADPVDPPVNPAIANNENLDVSDTTVVRIGLDPINVTLAVGDSMPLRATAYGPSGEPVRIRIRWSSGDTAIVRVGQDGWIRAMQAGGPVFVNAAAGGRIGVAVVQVQ